MQTSWKDRRATPRNHVAYRFDASDDRGNFLGCILDLSTLGLRVLLMEETADVQKIKGLCIELPRWLRLGPSIELKGSFVWCKDPEGSGDREAGFSFDTISSAQLSKLENLLKSLAQIQETA